MLSGPSFRSAYVFSINSLVMSRFPSTSFHSAEASVSAFSWPYTLARAVFGCVELFTFLVLFRA